MPLYYFVALPVTLPIIVSATCHTSLNLYNEYFLVISARLVGPCSCELLLDVCVNLL